MTFSIKYLHDEDCLDALAESLTKIKHLEIKAAHADACGDACTSTAVTLTYINNAWSAQP
jgi:hypothetical protein